MNGAGRIKRSGLVVVLLRLALTFLVTWSGPTLAQTVADTPEEAASTPDAGEAGQGMGGPSSVQGQISKDTETQEAHPGPALPRIPLRKRLEREYGLVFGADYNALYQHVTEGPSKDAAGGVFRFYGSWTLVNRGGTDPATVIFKIEDRHRLGTPIAPQILGPTAGYAGTTAPTFSDARGLLTNLYWTQSFLNNRFAFNAGVVDVTDYVDVYALVNVWTDFNNLSFSTNPTIAVPNQGLGAVARWMFTPNYYVIGGVADANANPHDPADFFSSIGKGELFKHVELGRIGSWANRYADNVHVTVWQVDRRKDAGVDSGWGMTLSWSQIVAERWVPFLRAGYSNGGATLVDRSISAGLGYQLTKRNDFVGFGAGWGSPPNAPNGSAGRDQYTFETYYRWQVLPQVQLVPSVQYVLHPALAPSKDDFWLYAIRMRAVF